MATSKHTREEHPVIISIWLITKNHNLKTLTSLVGDDFFNEASARHFATIDALLTQNLPVTEWRARSGIDADSIFTERARYARVKATVP